MYWLFFLRSGLDVLQFLLRQGILRLPLPCCWRPRPIFADTAPPSDTTSRPPSCSIPSRDLINFLELQDTFFSISFCSSLLPPQIFVCQRMVRVRRYCSPARCCGRPGRAAAVGVVSRYFLITVITSARQEFDCWDFSYCSLSSIHCLPKLLALMHSGPSRLGEV